MSHHDRVTYSDMNVFIMSHHDRVTYTGLNVFIMSHHDRVTYADLNVFIMSHHDGVIGRLRGLAVACWTTDHYHPCSNPGVGISEGCFVFHFVSLPLEVARPT